MTKKQQEEMNELKRKALKVVSLIKKIDESDKLNMTHRHDDYLRELDSCMEQMNELHSKIQK